MNVLFAVMLVSSAISPQDQGRGVEDPFAPVVDERCEGPTEIKDFALAELTLESIDVSDQGEPYAWIRSTCGDLYRVAEGDKLWEGAITEIGSDEVVVRHCCPDVLCARLAGLVHVGEKLLPEKWTCTEQRTVTPRPDRAVSPTDSPEDQSQDP